jgi:hypothetical protein
MTIPPVSVIRHPSAQSSFLAALDKLAAAKTDPMIVAPLGQIFSPGLFSIFPKLPVDVPHISSLCSKIDVGSSRHAHGR